MPPEIPAQTDTRTRAREVAWAMLRAGERPTQRGVIARMGGRGSPNVVNDVLQAFWPEVGAALERPPLPEAIAQAAEDLWALALAQADETFVAYRKRLAAEAETARHDAQVAQAEAEAARSEVRQRTEQLAERAAEIERLRERLAAETARREAAEQHIHETQQAREAAQQQLTEARQGFEARLVQEHERADASERRLVAQIDEQKTARERLERALAAHEAAARDREEALQRRLEVASREAAERQATVQQLDADRQSQGRALEQARQALQQREVEKAALATEVALLTRERDGHAKKREVLEVERAELRTRIEVLAAEKASLEGELERGRKEGIQALLERLEKPHAGEGDDPE